MAQSKLELDITWENNVSFEIDAKETLPGSPVKTYTIVKSDENNHITETWPAISDIVERYMKAIMRKIGEEMKT